MCRVDSIEDWQLIGIGGIEVPWITVSGTPEIGGGDLFQINVPRRRDGCDIPEKIAEPFA